MINKSEQVVLILALKNHVIALNIAESSCQSKQLLVDIRQDKQIVKNLIKRFYEMRLQNDSIQNEQ